MLQNVCTKTYPIRAMFMALQFILDKRFVANVLFELAMLYIEQEDWNSGNLSSLIKMCVRNSKFPWLQAYSKQYYNNRIIYNPVYVTLCQ